MLSILVTILIVSAYSYERIPKVSFGKDNLFPSRNFDRLSAILSREVTRNFKYRLDFFCEATRYNVSESDYSSRCLESYFAIKFAASEVSSFEEEYSALKKYMDANNITGKLPEEWTDFMPRTDLIMRYKVEAIDLLSTKALPETRKFIQYVQNKSMESFVRLLGSVLVEMYDRKSWLTQDQESSTDSEKYIKVAITQLALQYKSLSAEEKIDLETSLCVRNTLNWLNSEIEGGLTEFFEIFSDVVGLNVDFLLKDNDFLSKQSISELKTKIIKRAEEHNIDPQEFVNICANMISVMKVKREEMTEFNRSTKSFMGEKWGKHMYNTSEELWDGLLEENAPFIRAVSKRWNFIKSRPMFGFVQNFMRDFEEDFLLGLTKANGEDYTGEETIQMISKYPRKLLMLPWLDREFCLHLASETVLDREIEL